MKRNHIHLAQAVATDNITYKRYLNVDLLFFIDMNSRHMRKSSAILIFIKHSTLVSHSNFRPFIENM
jgi:hypothetical protein